MLRSWRNWLLGGRRGRPAPTLTADGPTAYQRWLHARGRLPARPVAPGDRPTFSILTTVYNTPPDLLREMADSLLAQTWAGFEWILLDNGSTEPEGAAAVRALGESGDARVRCFRIDQNDGIMPGMKLCLDRASGEYLVPVDSDDLLLPHALETLGRVALDRGRPAFLYSDEDLLVQGEPQSPYFRPSWDPVLNLCTSYVFHLCAFRRDKALDLGAYSDPRMNWCHDWDTLCRFAAAGETPVHVPEVLYHWRQHAQSSTNRPDPESGSMVSQRHLLQRHLDQSGLADRFAIDTFPISRGTPEFWLRRRPIATEPLNLLLRSADPARTLDVLGQIVGGIDHPLARVAVVGTESEISRPSVESRTFADGGLDGLREAARWLGSGLTVVLSDELQPQGTVWPWEAVGLRELHPDTALISGRIVNHARIVVAGGEIFGFGGLVGSPDYARHENDPGYYALSLKQRSVSAVHPAFFLADGRFLIEGLAGMPAVASVDFLGAWLGIIAAERGRRVLTSPLITAMAAGIFTGSQTPASPEEEAAFRARARGFLPDRRWYSPHFALQAGSAYALDEAPAAAYSRSA